jgi:hypothetical protein
MQLQLAAMAPMLKVLPRQRGAALRDGKGDLHQTAQWAKRP